MTPTPEAPKWSLPLELTEAIDDIVQRSCSDSARTFQNGADALSHTSQALYFAVKASLQRLSRSINDAVPINQLPRELFSGVLLRLSFQDRISMTHVCQQWRSVAINTPSLWTTFKGFSKVDGRLDHALAVLSRSGSAPVTVDLTLWNAGEHVGSLIRQHMHHMQSLTLVVNYNQGSGEHRFLPLIHALREPAPVLRQIELRGSGHVRHSRNTVLTVPPDFLAGNAPVLEAATFAGVVLNAHPYDALSVVRSLCVTATDLNLPFVFASYPRLQQLSLLATTLRDASITGSAGSRVVAPCLDRLHITPSMQYVNQILAQFSGSRPLTISMHNVQLDVFDRILSSAPKSAVTHLSLYQNFPLIHRAVELRYSTGFTWILSHMPDVNGHWVQRTLLDTDTMSGLTTLTMHELYWPEGSPLSAPHLRQLTIIFTDYVRKHNNGVSAESVGLFCETPDSPRAVCHCPGLEELCLAARPAQLTTHGTMLVDADDVCTFITRRLRFVGSPLAQIVLRNIHLLDSMLGGGMEKLTHLVRDISYRTMTGSPVPYIHRREQWSRWIYLLKD